MANKRKLDAAKGLKKAGKMTPRRFQTLKRELERKDRKRLKFL